MRLPDEDRALYLREIRRALRGRVAPELTSPQAIDAAGLIDRMLVQLIIDADVADGSDSDADGDTEHRRLEQLDDHRRAVQAETDADDAVAGEPCSVSPPRLTAFLRRRLPDSPAVVVEHISVVPGGRSKETMRVTVAGTDELPHEVILRKDRPVGVLPTRAADEFAILRAVHGFGGVPVPEPFFAGEDDTDLGPGTFLVMACVPGHRAGEFFPDLAAPTEHRPEIARQFAAALARLHALPLDLLTGTRLHESDATVSEESIVAAVDGMANRIDELSGPPNATVPLARSWLVEHASDVVPAPRVALLQSDVGFHNMLIEQHRITALVDWEAATVGPPARELAAAFNAATALVPWSEFVDAYVQAGGAAGDTDPRAIYFYRVFIALGGLMAARTGGHLFRTGAKRDLQTAHSSLDSQFRCARNLARALADAMS